MAPILDTSTYKVVEFPDGVDAEYAANTIAESMWDQCDPDGNKHLLMESIVKHTSDGHAVQKADHYTIVNGRKHKRKTTKGWSLCIQWKDGTTTWERRLSLLKESNPVEVAEYAVAQELQDEPAFEWWVHHTLKKRDRIISAVNARYHKKTHKFGIEPKSVQEARKLDQKNGDNLWEAAIQKELNAVRVAFEMLNDGDKAPPTYQQIRCHMVFDVKMDTFAIKAQYVAQDNMTEVPATLTYASVVSRELVWIALMLAALNALEVKTADIANAYLQAPITEKIWNICGPEFGVDARRPALLVRALYGLRSAGASFRNHLADCMHQLRFKPCLADADLWMRAETRPDDGFQYYTYALLYIHDVLVVSHDGMQVLEEIHWFFPMKKTSMGDPDMYLGAKIHEVVLPNREAVKNMKDFLAKSDEVLPKRAATPYAKDYPPEMDVSVELDDTEASYYQSHIGILIWMVEIGRVDIITEEAIPTNAPPACGKEIDIRLYCDSDHAGDRLTRRSISGFFIHLNMAPVQWQVTNRRNRYKLRMMGVPISGPTYIYGDNMSELSTTLNDLSPYSRRSRIRYATNVIRELVAMGESLTAHVPTELNPADLCTKVLSGGQKRDGIVDLWLMGYAGFEVALLVEIPVKSAGVNADGVKLEFL
eukprot:scaffold302773_cov75-Attheya_sp.AAC.1